MGVTSINTRASDLRERAYFKYPTLRTWISDLVKQPIRSQTSTWVTGTARWMKRYCQTVGRGNTVKALQHRHTVNDKTKISAWIKAHNMRNTGSWMGLQMRHPDIKLGLQDIGKIQMGCYWTAQRLVKAGLIPKMYIERCPFCNKNTPETIEHMLIECLRWNSIRHETTIFNIPRLYRTKYYGWQTPWGEGLKKPGRYFDRFAVGTTSKRKPCDSGSQGVLDIPAQTSYLGYAFTATP
ncbi:hypothetical protein BB560_003124 [Smittium megazygosporum]|uniref:Uncharacterized protein n=1 Tax=Smittium megazygosporum TaxID=133381 RepID=A0A2T9ZCU9_9FUNG|nr:hypothetical protein BB560_003124 [Smittium megazygosporum]